MLTAEIRRRSSSLLLLQHPDDLHIPRIVKSASSVSFSDGLYLNLEEDQGLRSPVSPSSDHLAPARKLPAFGLLPQLPPLASLGEPA